MEKADMVVVMCPQRKNESVCRLGGLCEVKTEDEGE